MSKVLAKLEFILGTCPSKKFIMALGKK